MDVKKKQYVSKNIPKVNSISEVKQSLSWSLFTKKLSALIFFEENWTIMLGVIFIQSIFGDQNDSF